MVALQIRGVSDGVRQALSDAAESRGQSLQAYLLELVEAEARRGSNLSLLSRFAGRDDGSRLIAAEATDAVIEARSRR